jgi:predicted metal-binding protein
MNSQRKNSKDGTILVCTSCDSFITDISSHQNYEFMKENIFSNKKIILFYAISNTDYFQKILHG